MNDEQPSPWLFAWIVLGSFIVGGLLGSLIGLMLAGGPE